MDRFEYIKNAYFVYYGWYTIVLYIAILGELRSKMSEQHHQKIPVCLREIEAWFMLFTIFCPMAFLISGAIAYHLARPN